MTTCPACGTQNTDTANFCISCGMDLTATATEQKLRTDSVAKPTASTPPMTSPSVDMPPGYLDSPSASVPNPSPAPSPTRSATSSPSFTPSASMPGYSSPAATKDRTLAMLFEGLPGMVCFLGIGWFYAGNIPVGLALLIGFWIVNFIGLIFDFILPCLFVLHFVFAIATVLTSMFMLYRYTQQHPELFGP